MGGLSAQGHEMPSDRTSSVSYDMYGDNLGNQAQPLLVSSKGRFIWSEEPIKYTFDKGTLTVTTRKGEIISGQEGKTLRDVYEHVSKTFFPSDGRIPDPLLFTAPQYNTWIELMYDQNEEAILTYARAIIQNGYPPGVLMIDCVPTSIATDQTPPSHSFLRFTRFCSIPRTTGPRRQMHPIAGIFLRAPRRPRPARWWYPE